MRNLIHIVAWTLFCSSPCFAEGETLNVDEESLNMPVSLELAAQQLTRDENNRVLGAETDLIDDREVHVIKVLTSNGHIRHIKIDAETGELIH